MQTSGSINELAGALVERVTQHIEIDVNQRKQARLRKEGVA